MSVRARLFGVGLLVGLTGCDNTQSVQQLHAWLQATQAREGDAVAAIPRVEPRAAFVYSAQALRSPFQAAGQAAAHSWQASLVEDEFDGKRPRQFLERFDLEQFEMVGTLSSDVEDSVLLRANGVVHRLSVGDYLGRNNGQIASINAGYIEVFEVISDGRGGALERSLTIPLKQQS